MKQEAEKQIICYACDSNELTAYIYFTIDDQPTISFDCAKCKEPIMGLPTTIDAVKFLLSSEDYSHEI